MIAQAKASYVERSSALAHTFNICHFSIQVACDRLRTCSLNILEDSVVAQSTDSLEVEERCEFEVETQFYTIVFLLQARKTEIYERVVHITIEVLPLRNVVKTAIVCIQVGVHP